MGGVDFDGTPISETDEEEHTDERIPGNITEYRKVWDHEDIRIEHDIVDRSEPPQDYRFASSPSREELRARYQSRGQGIRVDTADAAGAYINMNPDADLLMERCREALTNRNQAPPLDMSGDEEGVAVPARPATWPNGNPMWATDPISPIQLRMPPIPDPNRVFASLADSPEEMTDVPPVAQLRAFWETQSHPICDTSMMIRLHRVVRLHRVIQLVVNVARSLTLAMMSQTVNRGPPNRPLSFMLMRSLFAQMTIDR